MRFLPPEYYDRLQIEYRARRDLLLPVLEEAGFRTFRPDGAYYVMTDISAFGFADDVEFTRHLIRDIGVACVPGSSFYSVRTAALNKSDFVSARRMRHCAGGRTTGKASIAYLRRQGTSMKTSLRILLVICLHLTFRSVTTAQQSPDPEFNTTVEHPAFTQELSSGSFRRSAQQLPYNYRTL